MVLIDWFFVGLYLATSIGLSLSLGYLCRYYGIDIGKWCYVLGFIFVYLVVFSYYSFENRAYKKLCLRKSGFRQYKTLEEWQQENPGVWEKLDAQKRRTKKRSSQDFDAIFSYKNQRFITETDEELVKYSIRKQATTIKDIKTGELIVSNTNYYLGNPSRNLFKFIFFSPIHSECFSSSTYETANPESKFNAVQIIFRNDIKNSDSTLDSE